MKKLCLILAVFSFSNAFCQLSTGGGSTASITSEMPNVSPPSPTVASLMKFEEVPVNNYTGIPDISIPLYNIETLSKDIALNLSLKYHPSSIAIKEVASYTGLGWNLLAGGTVSRTVKGLPDEICRPGNANNFITPRVGIYNYDISNSPNKYYQVMNNTASAGDRAQYLWSAFEKGIFDSEHDLYQYNFMGHTGRFYIKKNTSNNQLEVVKLDNDNALQIAFTYTHDQSNVVPYVFSGFTIYDDKGYKYLFTTPETTTETVANLTTGWAASDAEQPQLVDPLTYISSFHLSSIEDNNGNQLLSITYQDVTEVTSRNALTYHTTPNPQTQA
ncbi:hypothetical protein FMM05_20660, partial [Flavobacterium zepuense]